MIKVESLSVRFGDFRIQDISLELPAGMSFVLLGPSGAGKSLLLETLLGIKRPESGTIEIDGMDITALPPEEHNIAYVPQDLALFPHLSVRENILFGLTVRKATANQTERLSEVSELLQITHLLGRRDVRTLSGGEKQRVALGRALITEPKILFLDEPFSALDTYLLRELQEQFRQPQQSLGLTVFQVTHDHDEAFILGDKIALMFNGRIAQTGAPQDLRQCPASLEVARFLMSRNEMRGVVESIDPQAGTMLTSVGSTALVSNVREGVAEGDDVYLSIRPESVRIVKPGRSPAEDTHNRFEATVLRHFQQSGRYVLYARVDELDKEIEISLTHCAFEGMSMPEAKTISVFLQPHALWPIPVGVLP